MPRRLDYRWNLRQVMAARGMFATTDLIGPLAQRGIRLSSSQVYRLVAERPERLSLKVLMALLDILDCSINDLIEPVAQAGGTAIRKKKAAGSEASIGDLRPHPGGPASTGLGDRGRRRVL
jgi:DNA-binding Xre family transcriptional regulator